MGFLDGLGRFVRGEDVFSNEETPKSTPPPVSSEDTQKQSPLVDERGYKIIPPVAIEHLSARRNGDRVFASAWITNHSDRPVWVESFTIQGQKQVFNRDIEPNKSFQAKIYEGPVALSEHGDAELVFRIKENDDRFKNVYDVEFNREADGKYVIEELHDDGPARDI